MTFSAQDFEQEIYMDFEGIVKGSNLVLKSSKDQKNEF